MRNRITPVRLHPLQSQFLRQYGALRLEYPLFLNFWNKALGISVALGKPVLNQLILQTTIAHGWNGSLDTVKASSTQYLVPVGSGEFLEME